MILYGLNNINSHITSSLTNQNLSIVFYGWNINALTSPEVNVREQRKSGN